MAHHEVPPASKVGLETYLDRLQVARGGAEALGGTGTTDKNECESCRACQENLEARGAEQVEQPTRPRACGPSRRRNHTWEDGDRYEQRLSRTGEQTSRNKPGALASSTCRTPLPSSA